MFVIGTEICVLYHCVRALSRCVQFRVLCQAVYCTSAYVSCRHGVLYVFFIKTTVVPPTCFVPMRVCCLEMFVLLLNLSEQYSIVAGY